MSARVLAGTVSLMTRGQLRVLNTVRANGFRAATGIVLADGDAKIDCKRGSLVHVTAGGLVLNPHELDYSVWIALGRPPGRPNGGAHFAGGFAA